MAAEHEHADPKSLERLLARMEAITAPADRATPLEPDDQSLRRQWLALAALLESADRPWASETPAAAPRRSPRDSTVDRWRWLGALAACAALVLLALGSLTMSPPTLRPLPVAEAPSTAPAAISPRPEPETQPNQPPNESLAASGVAWDDHDLDDDIADAARGVWLFDDQWRPVEQSFDWVDYRIRDFQRQLADEGSL